MKKVELLSPAGNMESLECAICAGADAVYLGGQMFGARAYADNFTTEQLCDAIYKAHFYGRKIYLTLNTLIKQEEISQVVSYVEPFYVAGLDGVIVQDFGVLSLLHEAFPNLELHASTQMTITGRHAVAYLKEKGLTRIVPARELTLEEIKEIKKHHDIELECFIHGAMCYCYSGQCLFSSILGGRSGNRGRCAQPCRLPYKIEGDNIAGGSQEIYPLSLKDMCTLDILPELIDAGIDSFKIEGRMKRPEYVAGVTALYRKYIDLYLEKGKAGYHISEEDRNLLKQLYIRSEIQDGYYYRHNGKEMITLHSPSYHTAKDTILKYVQEQYMRPLCKEAVSMYGFFEAGQPARLTVAGSDFSVTVEGAYVEPAQNKPTDIEQIKKQLAKTGNSFLDCEEIFVELATGQALFIPVKHLNELRRSAVKEYEAMRMKTYGTYHDRESEIRKEDYLAVVKRKASDTCQLEVSVMTMDQLRVCMNYQVTRIYIDSDLYRTNFEQIKAFMESEAKELYLAFPYILRKRDEQYLADISAKIAKDTAVKGFLIRNLEAFAYLKKMFADKDYRYIADASLYHWNADSIEYLCDDSYEITLPYELNQKEILQMTDSLTREIPIHHIVYGRHPMMITANCIRKTGGACDHNSRLSLKEGLVDRYHKKFPVYNNCMHCYNVIYNSVPFQNYSYISNFMKHGISWFRLDFVYENSAQTEEILKASLAAGTDTGWKEITAKMDATTGHIKRGVE